MKKESQSKAKASTSSTLSKGIFWVLGFAFLLFSNTLINGYNMDDNIVTQNHPLTSKGLSATKEIFTSNYFNDAMGNSFGYRPMVHFSFALEKSLFGESAKVSHFVNLVIYLLILFLFYKLLIRWLGKEKEGFALVTTLLFAIHPIHSEVVASIKNRDEMLAFLFAIAAGIFIHKFCATKKWFALLGIALFFTLGLLSKKSIFPLVFVFPLAQLFVSKTPIKLVLISTIALLIPSAIIVGETDVIKSLIVFFIPLAAVYFAHLFRVIMFESTVLLFVWNKIKSSQLIFVSIFTWVLIGYGFYSKSDLYFIIGGLLILTQYSNLVFQFVNFSLLLAFFSYLNKTFVPLELTFFFGLYYLICEKGKIKAWTIYLLIAVAVGCNFIIEINKGASIFALILPFNKLLFLGPFFLFIRKKTKVSWAIVLLLALVFGISQWYVIFIAAIGLLLLELIKIDYIKNIKKAFLIGVIALASMVYFTIENNQILQPTPPKIERVETIQPSQQITNTVIKEGRNLEYVENTLVAAHSFEETVGTGMMVLGEYIRLMVFPRELSFYYGFSKVGTSTMYSINVLLIFLVYLTLCIVAIVKIKSRPIIMVGVVWFIGSILLFSNWVELVAGMIGERLAFTASAGFILFVVAIIYWVKPTIDFRKPQKLEIVCLLIGIALCARTFVRNSDWKDSITLMSKDILHLENSAQANNLLAMALMSETQTNTSLDESTVNQYRKNAVNYFNKAIFTYPNFFNYHFDLGRSFILLNDNKNAKKAFFNAYKIQPNNLLAIEELTKTSFDLGEFSDTVFYGNLYIEANPANENIHELVAYICLLNKDLKSANTYAKRGLKFFPSNPNLNKIIADTQ